MVPTVALHPLWISGLKSAWRQKLCVVNSGFEKSINYHKAYGIFLIHSLYGNMFVKCVTYDNVQCIRKGIHRNYYFSFLKLHICRRAED